MNIIDRDLPLSKRRLNFPIRSGKWLWLSFYFCSKWFYRIEKVLYNYTELRNIYWCLNLPSSSSNPSLRIYSRHCIVTNYFAESLLNCCHIFPISSKWITPHNPIKIKRLIYSNYWRTITAHLSNVLTKIVRNTERSNRKYWTVWLLSVIINS